MNISEGPPVRILAADDSAVVRGIMRKLFQMHCEDPAHGLPPMELCGTARDGQECLDAVTRLSPDVLVLDLEMPRLNGLDVLERLREQNSKLPVIMCSSHTECGARSTLEALARGASDYVMKPVEQRDLTAALQTLSQQLLPRISALVQRRRRSVEQKVSGNISGLMNQTAPEGEGAPVAVVVIGLSTGGPSALEDMLPRLPSSFAVPVLIVQHMPKLFTGALAERLDRSCALRVMQAYDGAPITPGIIWLAPGDSHMEIAPRWTGMGADKQTLTGRATKVRLHQREPLNHCRPSVDYLFHSAASMYGAGTLALMMTGMGADGLEGARAVHQVGGTVLAQDEATSAVWGMPGRIAEAGIASAVLPLNSIAAELKQRVAAGRLKRSAPAERLSGAVQREGAHGLL